MSLTLHPTDIYSIPLQDCGEGKEEYKPRALQRLEAILADKLFNAGRTARLLGPEGPGYSTCLLECQAYRQAFDAFIQSFTTYRPLLMKIKKEYDVAFEDALKAAHENIHMRADLVEAQRQRVLKYLDVLIALEATTLFHWHLQHCSAVHPNDKANNSKSISSKVPKSNSKALHNSDFGSHNCISLQNLLLLSGCLWSFSICTKYRYCWMDMIGTSSRRR